MKTNFASDAVFVSLPVFPKLMSVTLICKMEEEMQTVGLLLGVHSQSLPGCALSGAPLSTFLEYYLVTTSFYYVYLFFLINPVIFLSFIFIVDAITDVSILPHSLPPSPHSFRPSPNYGLCLWVTHACCLADPFPFFHPVPSPPPLAPLSVSCSHASVSILFAKFVLFMRFHMQVRSHGILNCPAKARI